jgi:hypothetical protein
MLASEQGMDEYHALFGVGGGLRLVAASLLATNSSLGGNSAARLGQQVALVQACWRVRMLSVVGEGARHAAACRA